MSEKKINKSRRNFLFGAVRRYKKEQIDGPAASTASAIELVKSANSNYVDGDFEAACDCYKGCLEKDKNDADVRYRLGVCLYKLEKYRQAKLEFERAIRIEREYQDAFLYLGLTMTRLDKPQKAVALWKQYFNPTAVGVQRELNLQIGMLEAGVADPPDVIAQSVEKAIFEAGDGVK